MNPSTGNRTRAAALLLLVLICAAAALVTRAPRLGSVAAAQGSPTPTPAGGEIAFVRGGSLIYLMDADGGQQRQLTFCDPKNEETVCTNFDNNLAWSPDGRRLAFDTSTDVGDIWAVDADGRNPVQLTHDRLIPSFSPTWSPDGTKIAFGKRGSLWVMDADGSNQRPILSNGTNPGFAFFSPDWSRDGRKLAFSRRTFACACPPEIFVAEVDAGGDLTQPPQGPLAVGDFPAWSPDGTKIAFNSDGSIRVMEADGTGERVVASGSAVGSPGWSPDGQKLVFALQVNVALPGATPVSRRRIFTANADGTGLTQLTAGGTTTDDYSPAWRSAPAAQATPTPTPAPTPNTPAGAEVAVQLSGVKVTFDSVTAAGDTTAKPIDPAQAGALPGQYALGDGAGDLLPAFEVSTTAAHAGNIVVCLNVTPPLRDQGTFDTLRLLHGEGGLLVDRTILAPDQPAPLFGTPSSFADQTICARTTSLSPFVVARLADANRAPISAAHNVTVEAGGACSAVVTAADVDAGSSDPDGDALTLSLSPAGPFGLGSHAVTLTATDTHGASSTAAATVTVVDTSPPQIAAPSDVTAYTGAGAVSCGAFVSEAALGAANASDNCSVAVARAGVPAGNLFPVGTTVVTYTATDAAGNTATATQNVTVIDNTPPAITGASVDKPVLHPPNHKMVDVAVSYSATDNCGAVSTSLSVTSNEPVDGAGDGHTSPDWEVLDAHHVRLRAERSGRGAGRLYTITITASDARGNAATRQVTVSVPHN